MAHRRAPPLEKSEDDDIGGDSGSRKEKPLSIIHIVVGVILVAVFIVVDLSFYTTNVGMTVGDEQMGKMSASGVEKMTIPQGGGGAAAFASSQDNGFSSTAAIVKDVDKSSSNSNGLAKDLPTGCLTTIPPEDYGPHRVPPPAGDVTLVCCESTQGILNIAVHPTWAPIGAGNFMNMVNSKYFESRVPMMRALKGFLIQFGLSSLPETQKEFETKYLKGKGGLKDDPQWLPEGPPGRQSEDGVRRFKKGYLAYAGAGKNSRGTQLIVALEDNLYLGGGSPWEVPWGHLFGEESFATLAKFYTGYGDKVSQGKIRNRGREYLDSEVPKLDYITACHVAAEMQPWRFVDSDRKQVG